MVQKLPRHEQRSEKDEVQAAMALTVYAMLIVALVLVVLGLWLIYTGLGGTA